MLHILRWVLLWCWLGSAMGATIQAVTEELPHTTIGTRTAR